MRLTGISTFNGITFHIDNYKIAARRKKGKNRIRISKLHTIIKQPKVVDKLYTLPFVRGLCFFAFFLLRNKLFLLFSLVLVLLYVFKIDTGPADMDVGATLLGFVLVSLVAKFSPLSAYHGAEHKTINAIKKGSKPLSELTREDIKGADRVSERCGSNLAIMLIAVMSLLQFLPVDPTLSMLAAMAISYELFRRDNKLTRPFRVASAWLQGALLTSEPGDKQLDLAYQAIDEFRNLLMKDSVEGAKESGVCEGMTKDKDTAKASAG